MKEIDKINSAIRATKKTPIKNEKVEMLADDLERIKRIRAFWHSEASKDMLIMLRTNCTISLARAINNASTTPDINILVSALMEYKSNIAIISSVLDISQEAEIQNQLDEALKEVYDIRE